MELTVEEEQLVEDCMTLIKTLTERAAEIIKEGFNETTKKVETKTTIWDVVTEYDKKIELLYIDEIKEKYPEHQFISEESYMNIVLTDKPTWLIDPIDGTRNFVQGFPIFAISVALLINKDIVLGMIYMPMLNEVYTATKGKGSFLNGKKIHCSNVVKLNQSYYAHDAQIANNIGPIGDKNFRRVTKLVRITSMFLSLGCVAAALAYVAKGCIDCYSVEDMKPWDYAAGVILIREAGGIVCKTNGDEFNILEPNLLCGATNALCQELIEIIRLTEN